MAGSPPTAIAPTPRAPTYADIGLAVRLLEGEPAQRVRDMMNAIYEHASTSAGATDWSEPDRWIDEVLSGELRTLAHKLWAGSGKNLNPRYFYACYLFVTRLKLLDQVGGIYRLAERGRRFLAGDEAILRELVTLRSSKRRPARSVPTPEGAAEC